MMTIHQIYLSDKNRDKEKDQSRNSGNLERSIPSKTEKLITVPSTKEAKLKTFVEVNNELSKICWIHWLEKVKPSWLIKNTSLQLRIEPMTFG